jgi:hypothetical protein
MDSLTRFLDTGGQLFITGQNIGQELFADDFYRDRLHARLINPTVAPYYLYGNRQDSLGTSFGQTQSAGTGGASNQNSRDEIAPDSLARAFLLYDTTSRQVSGIYYHDPNHDSRMIYLGFGFEAVNKPSNQPTFMSRVTFFNVCYAWLTGTTGVLESPASACELLIPSVSVSPNPFRDQVVFRFSPTANRKPRTSEVKSECRILNTEVRIPDAILHSVISNLPSEFVGQQALCIYDATGKLVRSFDLTHSLAPSLSYSLSWDGRYANGITVPSGVYFYSLAFPDRVLTGRIQLVR